MGQTGFQGVKQYDVNCGHPKYKIGLKPVIQIDLIFFAHLSCFILPFQLHSFIASKNARYTFVSLDILSLMIWTQFKTNMPTWLPLSGSKGSLLWLLWIVVYLCIPLFRRNCKTPCGTKGSRLDPRSY